VSAWDRSQPAVVIVTEEGRMPKRSERDSSVERE
jgi:hypothetical protein